MSRARALGWSALALAIAGVALYAMMSTRIIVFDEGIPLVGAMRVVAGEIPHRDFYSNYAPAPFYILAGLFKIFGPSVAIGRALDLTWKAAIVATVAYISLREGRPWLAALAALTSLIWLIGLSEYGYVLFPVTLLALWGTWLLAPTARGVSLSRAFAAGACTGAAALFRYDLAGLLFIAQVLSIFLIGRGSAGPRLLHLLTALAAGCAVVFLPSAALYVTHAPLQAFFSDIMFNVRFYAAGRRLPWPGTTDYPAPMGDWAVYAPPIVLIASLVWALRRPPGRDRSLVLLFSGLMAIGIVKATVRVSAIHMTLALMVMILLVTFLSEQILRRGGKQARIYVGLIFAGLLLLAATGMTEHPGAPLVLSFRTTARQPRELAPGRLTADLAAATAFVAQETQPDERIYVGELHHDRYLLNPVVAYLAADRLPATHWHLFDPDLQSRADIQEQIIRELDQRRVRWLILEDDPSNEPNDSGHSSGVHLLDNYIRANYAMVRQSGVDSVWQRLHQ